MAIMYATAERLVRRSLPAAAADAAGLGLIVAAIAAGFALA